MAPKPKPPAPEVSPAVAAILTDGWGGVVEHVASGGYLLFPDKLRRRRHDGSIEETPIMLRVPREPDLRKARVAARRQAEQEGIDEERDKDLFEGLERIHLLASCIRNAKPPHHEAWEPEPAALESRYDTESLAQLWRKVHELRARLDPGDAEISPQQMVVLMARLSEAKHLGPLADYASAAQTSFIVSMAEQLLTFLVQKSSTASPEPSTPGSSRATNSTRSSSAPT